MKSQSNFRDVLAAFLLALLLPLVFSNFVLDFIADFELGEGELHLLFCFSFIASREMNVDFVVIGIFDRFM
jgi:hypothetical protein